MRGDEDARAVRAASLKRLGWVQATLEQDAAAVSAGGQRAAAEHACSQRDLRRRRQRGGAALREKHAPKNSVTIPVLPRSVIALPACCVAAAIGWTESQSLSTLAPFLSVSY